MVDQSTFPESDQRRPDRTVGQVSRGGNSLCVKAWSALAPRNVSSSCALVPGVGASVSSSIDSIRPELIGTDRRYVSGC